MKRFKIDLYYDKDYKRYALTQFVFSENINEAKPTGHWHNDTFKVEEDANLEKAVIFKASIIRHWEDGYGCDHHDYVKTFYVQAFSYWDATAQIRSKFEANLSLKDCYIGKIQKDERTPLEILLSL